MAEVHGSLTVIKVAPAPLGVPGTVVDISAHCNTSDWTEAATVEDVSGYGTQYARNLGNINSDGLSIGGVYDSDATNGPRAVFGGQRGKLFQITRQIEGTGTGKPQRKIIMTLTSFKMSIPQNGYVKWSADFASYSAPDDTPQP